MKRNTGMFKPYWYDLEGKKLGPLRGRDIAEAHRLWREHSDIRLGQLSREGLEEETIEELFGL